VHNSKKRIKVVRAGRRWGKGVCACFEGIGVIDLLKDVAPFRPEVMVPAYRMWVVGPSYPELDDAWEEFDHHLAKTPLETRSPLIDEKTRFLVNDGRLQFKSADNPKSLQNVALDWVWITESQDIEDSVWDNQISPMLHSPGVLGWAFIEGKAPKPGTWYERLWEQGQIENPEVESWHFYTKDNPHIDWDAIVREAEMIGTPDEKFREEYFAEQPSVYGRAFNEAAIDMCVGGELEAPRESARYVFGIDLGKQVDPTVIIGMRPSQKRVVHFERLLHTDWTVQEDIITNLSEQWNKPTFFIDVTGLGQPVVDRLKKNGVNVRAINLTKEKNVLLNKLAAGLEHGDIRYPNIPVLIRELKNMRRHQKDKHGVTLRQEKIAAPVGHHDDCPVALALAYYGCRYSGDFEVVKPRYLGARV